MPTIEADNDLNFLIDGIPRQKGMFWILTNTDDLSSTDVNIKIKTHGESLVIKEAYLSQWKKGGGGSFVDLQDFCDYIKPFFFRNLGSGGGGNGDGFSGEVNTFNDLPTPAIDYDKQYWIVLTTTKTGSIFNRNVLDSGTYRSLGGAWEYRGPDVPYYFVDDNLYFADGSTGNKLAYTLDGLTGNRTADWQDKDGTVAYLDDIKGNIIGISDDATEFVTFSETGVVYLNLPVTGLDNSKQYLATAYYIWAHDATNTDFFAELRNFGVLLPPQRHQQEPKDSAGGVVTDQRHYTSCEWIATPTAGQIQLDLLFGTTDSDDESIIYGCVLKLYKLD